MTKGVEGELLGEVERIRLYRELVRSRVTNDSQSGFIASQVDILSIHNRLDYESSNLRVILSLNGNVEILVNYRFKDLFLVISNQHLLFIKRMYFDDLS